MILEVLIEDLLFFAEENPFSTEIISPGANNNQSSGGKRIILGNPDRFCLEADSEITLLGYFFRVDAGWGKMDNRQ
ncbi:MAG: hypothetical protein IPO64_14470 [Bacteroidetes bacterium]|nr:hypothetical protein [Bacteroidota bacterium]